LNDYRIKLLSKFQGEVESKDYLNQIRDNNPTAFTRSRVFTFKRLIVLIMLLRTSYQREINQFCKLIFKGDYNIRQATAGALTQARAKLNPYAFTRLHELSISTFYEEADFIKWNGFRLLAVDGSVLNLPYSEDIINEFGSEDYINKSSGIKSLARCSLLYDVLNQVTIDAQISGYKTSEKALMEAHLSFLEDTDLVLGDRGYAYSAIMHWLSARNVDFCFRFHDTKTKAVLKFRKSNQTEQIIDIHLDRNSIKSMDLPKDTAPIKVRLIKVQLENGQVEVLGTSLLDKNKYKAEIFKDLYHKRWGVEEAFKMLKSRINLEDFSGRTARSIYQDFHAKVFMMTLCAVMSHPIEQKVRLEYSASKSGNKYDQKINRMDAIAETRSNLILMMIDKQKQRVVDVMDKIILASRNVIRPNRSFKRPKIVRKRKPLNYKRL